MGVDQDSNNIKDMDHTKHSILLIMPTITVAAAAKVLLAGIHYAKRLSQE